VGLAIVSRIVASSGGEIEAFNDGGAVVEFTLQDRV
jgi:signal transduction histidine kinase